MDVAGKKNIIVFGGSYKTTAGVTIYLNDL